jgi:heptaprenylglyceryl phosphate synthase
VNYQNCVAPTVSFVTPSANNTTVTSAGFNLSALVQNSNNGQGITLTNNGRGITNFSFNNATGSLTSNVTLVPGANVFVIAVTNACGTDTETVTVNYQNCVAPTVTFISPASSPLTVTSPNYNMSATVLNSNNGEGITATQNGKIITSGTFNPANGSLTGSVVLSPGANVFVVTVTNACGTDTETVTVNYQNCIAPTVTFISPASSPLTVTSPNYNMSATVLNSNNGEGITATQNGKIITSGTFNPANGSLTGSVVLSPGANVFVVTVTNACGTDTETVTIFYEEEEENNSDPEQMITICHIPPGNNGNPQTIQIPLSAWPAHQAHGDVLGSCVVEEEPAEENNGGQTEQKITICHIPPGNNSNPQTIEIPLSAWPAHQAHGDVLGPCSEEPAENDNNGQGSNSNNNNGESNSSGFGGMGMGNVGNGSGSSNGNAGNGSNGEGDNGESGGGSNGGGGNNSNNQPKEPQIVKPKGVTPKGGISPTPKTPVKEPVKETNPEEKGKEKGKEKEVPVEESTPPPPLKGRGGK